MDLRKYDGRRTSPTVAGYKKEIARLDGVTVDGVLLYRGAAFYRKGGAGEHGENYPGSADGAHSKVQKENGGRRNGRKQGIRKTKVS